jgi:threonine synthase
MRYISTRGGIAPIPFSEAVMMGLASDGGLLLPAEIPAFSAAELAELPRLSYDELALRIFSRFIAPDDIPLADLQKLIAKSYQSFADPAVVPLRRVGRLYLQELFHGPTLAFKDVALQFLGNLFEYLLARRGESLNILGATSGDTGSAAIHGLRGKERIRIFILHPAGKVSPIQEKQMTSVLDANVFNLAVAGTFDDGQRIVKEIFADLEFKQRYRLGAVNSINWARIMAQIVYYFSAWCQLPERERENLAVVVPTGNFGNIFAGWMARALGLPLARLILATNANDILHRFIAANDYRRAEVVPTYSPSMDIQLASNFERYLYYLHDGDPEKLQGLLADFAATGRLKVAPEAFAQVQREFFSARADNPTTLEIIRKAHENHAYILDPHTAAGVHAARCYLREVDNQATIVALATAHPAKFPEAVAKAIGTPPPQPEAIAALAGLPCRCQQITADTGAVKEYIKRKCEA